MMFDKPNQKRESVHSKTKEAKTNLSSLSPHQYENSSKQLIIDDLNHMEDSSYLQEEGPFQKNSRFSSRRGSLKNSRLADSGMQPNMTLIIEGGGKEKDGKPQYFRDILKDSHNLPKSPYNQINFYNNVTQNNFDKENCIIYAPEKTLDIRPMKSKKEGSAEHKKAQEPNLVRRIIIENQNNQKKKQQEYNNKSINKKCSSNDYSASKRPQKQKNYSEYGLNQKYNLNTKRKEGEQQQIQQLLLGEVAQQKQQLDQLTEENNKIKNTLLRFEQENQVMKQERAHTQQVLQEMKQNSFQQQQQIDMMQKLMLEFRKQSMMPNYGNYPQEHFGPGRDTPGHQRGFSFADQMRQQ